MVILNFPYQILDAKESIKCDENFVKGYFRKGSAHVALAQLDLAVKDFKQVCKMMPQDREARSKYEETLKEFKLREFAKCIQTDDKKIEINLEDLQVESSYTCPRLEDIDDITTQWVIDLMD